MKTDRKGTPPVINQKDLVLAVIELSESEDIKLGHMLCVVHNVEENLVMLKNVLSPLDSQLCDERNYNMYK